MEICRDCRDYWGKLTDDDLRRIDGHFDRFVSTLRARYGFSQLKAEEELEQFLFCYSDGPGSTAQPAALAKAAL
jgi:uncharacterized protein YjbJ (UPF0337 family)